MNKRAWIAALLSLALAGVARAQDTADEAKKAAVLEEARQHVAKAKVHYDLGEFKEAADEYIIVYRLRPIPALLFNIAQAYRQGGLYDKARQFYKSYLRESPDAKNRASIEQSIREMDELLAKEKKTRDSPPLGVKDAPDASLPMPETKTAAKPATSAPPPMPFGPEATKPPEVAQAKPAETKPAPKLARANPPPPQASEPQTAMPATAKPATPAPSAATSATPAPSAKVEEEGGILTKWWFWTAAGVVVVGAGAAAMTMGGNTAPASHFPPTPVFP